MFLDYLNQKHDNIKYTMEGEDCDGLAFLDTTVHRNKCVTSVYRKPTFTGLGMSYFSYCDIFKINAIKTLSF